jgi:F420H(2)-dependent biliverdin reductase
VPVRFEPDALPGYVLRFLRDRHLATLTTLRADGTPHVVPVGFVWDDEARVAWMITSGDSQKARNALRGGRAAVCQVDGRRWLTLEGEAAVLVHPEAVADAERRYAERYRTPRENPARVVLQVAVDRVTGWIEDDGAGLGAVSRPGS